MGSNVCSILTRIAPNPDALGLQKIRCEETKQQNQPCKYISEISHQYAKVLLHWPAFVKELILLFIHDFKGTLEAAASIECSWSTLLAELGVIRVEMAKFGPDSHSAVTKMLAAATGHKTSECVEIHLQGMPSPRQPAICQSNSYSSNSYSNASKRTSTWQFPS